MSRPAAMLCAVLALPLVASACRPEREAGQSATIASQSSSLDGAASSGALELTDHVLNPIIDGEDGPLPPLRVISGGPNISEMLVALGAQELIVGRTDYCIHPPSLLEVRSVGALVNVNIEVLLELRPDTVLIPGASQAMTDRLRPLSLDVRSVPDESFGDLYRAVRDVGQAVGRPHAADKLCERIAEDFARVDARFGTAEPRRVLLLVGTLGDPPAPPFVAGAGSFFHDLLERAGHENVVPPGHRPFATLSLEFILRSDPDVIIELDPDGRTRPGGQADALRAWSRIGGLRAVAGGRVHVITGPQHYLLGPRLAFTYAAIRAAIERGE